LTEFAEIVANSAVRLMVPLLLATGVALDRGCSHADRQHADALERAAPLVQSR
jgi:hypothetical protein